ncbi:MAG: hypothetical protein KC729_10970, partial [Candidatus Eisenbacteria bacterium]|nr:hypothetical protein [Candidatus Eisenbacteria bacterium]
MSSVEAGSGFAFGAVLAAMLSALSAIWWRWRLRGPQWIDAPRSDRHHRDATSKAGGPTWLTGFLVGAIGIWLLRFRGVDSSRTLGADDLALAVVAAAAVLGYLLGDLDDRDRLRPLPKAILQASLVVAAWACCAVGAGPVAGPAWLWLGAAL